MARRQWWEPPKLWGLGAGEAEAERRVSWLELFSDLIFVVVISQLAHFLAGHLSWSGLLGYSLLFTAAWWSWIGGTVYNERFETQDISYRLTTFLYLLTIAGMAIFAHNGLGEGSERFGLAYAANRALIVALWLRGGYHSPPFRPVSQRYAIGFALSCALFLAAAFVPAPWRFVLWGLGLASDLYTPITTLRFQAQLPQVHASKLPERFGLFVIIALGEAIVGVIAGVAESEPFTWQAGLAGLLGLALAFGIWWIYFDFIARRIPRRGMWPLFGWMYLHMPLLMAVAALSAAVLNLLAHRGADVGVRWLLAGSLALALGMIGAIEMLLRRGPDEPTTVASSVGVKCAAAGAALLVGLVGQALPALLYLALLVPPLLMPMVYGAWVWFHQELAPEALMVEVAD